MTTRLPRLSPRSDYLTRYLPTAPTARGCHEWTGPMHSNGYGWAWDSDRKRMVYAHRLAFEIAHGATLGRWDIVRHACDNPACVNVDHLSVGTQADNMRDKAERGRAAAIRGESNRSARLTAPIVRDIRVRVAAGETHRAVALRYGVSQPAVTAIVKRRAWRHVE